MRVVVKIGGDFKWVLRWDIISGGCGCGLEVKVEKEEKHWSLNDSSDDCGDDGGQIGRQSMANGITLCWELVVVTTDAHDAAAAATRHNPSGDGDGGSRGEDDCSAEMRVQRW